MRKRRFGTSVADYSCLRRDDGSNFISYFVGSHRQEASFYVFSNGISSSRIGVCSSRQDLLFSSSPFSNRSFPISE